MSLIDSLSLSQDADVLDRCPGRTLRTYQATPIHTTTATNLDRVYRQSGIILSTHPGTLQPHLKKLPPLRWVTQNEKSNKQKIKVVDLHNRLQPQRLQRLKIRLRWIAAAVQLPRHDGAEVLREPGAGGGGRFGQVKLQGQAFALEGEGLGFGFGFLGVETGE